MADTLRDRTLALAAILQPIDQVQTIARKGQHDAGVLETSVKSIVNMAPVSVDVLFGGVGPLTRGLELLIQQFDKKNGEINKEMLHYFVGVNQLQKKLLKDARRLNTVTEGVQDVERKLQYFSWVHDSTIARLAEIYSSAVSDLSPRIIVQGEQVYLSSATYINRIRALLLAAIRATVLWKQCGGGPIKLLFERKKTVTVAENLLNQHA